MITFQKPDLLSFLSKGIEKAKLIKRPILTSVITQVKKTNPLAFFYAGRKQKGTRVFWSDPEKKCIMVGIGHAAVLETNQNDRFQWMEQKWRNLFEEAIITDHSIPGAGPTLFGGFSFDPLRKKTPLWKMYPSAKLTLPKFLLTQYKGETWLTIHFLLRESDDPAQLAKQAMAEKNMLLQQTTIPSSSSYITKIEEIAPKTWIETVEKAKQDIQSGLLEKIVLARELRIFAETDFCPESILERLQLEQRGSYIFAFESGNDCFLGATPERLAKRQGEDFFFTSLAGSIKRGRNQQEDEQLGMMLLQDQKNRYEHQLVVDMIKNIVESMCQQVDTPLTPTLYKMRDIQHLHTPIRAKAKGHSLLEIVNALHPTPALGGFPQDIAIKKLRQMEGLDRGWYASPVGWINHDGNGEFAVAIRSALVQGKKASLFAGCGIVNDSDPLSEYQETAIKFKPMLSALGEEAI